MKASINATSSAALMLVSLSGCAQQPSFVPVPGGEEVTITVKVPQNLMARSMRVMYRSTTCPSKESADGVPYEIDGFYPIEVQPQRRGITDLYEAKLARSGGGACQWKLSNVTFGVQFANTSLYGANARAGGGGGIIVVFDDNPPQQVSYPDRTKVVSGDLLIKEDYYPWVSEAFLGGYEKLVRLVGDGDIYLPFKASSAKTVEFAPVLHDQQVVYSAEGKVKQKGNYTKFTYPDGSVIADGSSEPDFDKLQAIRLKKTQ